MSQPRFYTGPEPLTVGAITLSAQESRHASLARRLSAGDPISLFDGLGTIGHGSIAKILKKSIVVEVLRLESAASDAALHLVVATALPKGPRQDILFEKCTELGVAAIWPLLSERSVVKPSGERLGKWQRTVIEACKQSGRAWLPAVGAPQTFSEVITRCTEFDLAVIADRDNAAVACHEFTANQRVVVLVGPEGGFSPTEQARASSAGLVVMRLAKTMLRTETAAITVAAQVLGRALYSTS